MIGRRRLRGSTEPVRDPNEALLQAREVIGALRMQLAEVRLRMNELEAEVQAHARDPEEV